MKRTGVTVAFAFLLAAYVLVGPVFATEYIIHDLHPILGGSTSDAYGVNNSGQVVGSAGNGAYMWSAATGKVDIPGLPDSFSNTAYAINDSGVVAGGSTIGFPPLDSEAFRWSAETGTTPLGPYVPGWGRDINASGQIVGGRAESQYVSSSWWRWLPSGNLAGIYAGPGQIAISATGINSFGAAAGSCGPDPDEGGPPETAVMWNPDSSIPISLGTLGGTSSFGSDINDLGQVVGQADTAGGQRHAFLWTLAGGMLDLGVLGGTNSRAYGINNLGQVVGTSNGRAFIWDSTNGMRDLGTLPGFRSFTAYSISDTGYIVGIATTDSVPTHAILWEPIPEPAGIAALLTGLAGFGVAVRRRRR